MRNLHKIVSYSFFILSLYSSQNAFALPCSKIIENHSNATWTFIVGTNNDVTFNVDCTTNLSCKLKPGESVTLVYPHGGMGEITLLDSNQQAATFSYESGLFSCPYIYSKGDTGGVKLNVPKGGDIVIEQDTWGKIIGHYANK